MRGFFCYKKRSAWFLIEKIKDKACFILNLNVFNRGVILSFKYTKRGSSHNAKGGLNQTR